MPIAHHQRPGMADRARDFLVDQFDEMPAVVQLGQRVVRGELVDLLVVAGLDAGVADELEDGFAQGDVVAIGGEGSSSVTGSSLKQGAIGRPQVTQPVGIAIAPDLAVAARHRLVRNVQVGLLRAPDGDRLAYSISARLPRPSPWITTTQAEQGGGRYGADHR